MAPTFCEHCGAQGDPSAVYCETCGTRRPESPQVATEPPAPPVVAAPKIAVPARDLEQTIPGRPWEADSPTQAIPPRVGAPVAVPPPPPQTPVAGRPNRGLIAAIVVAALAVAGGGVGVAFLLTRAKSAPPARAATIGHRERAQPRGHSNTITNTVTVTTSQTAGDQMTTTNDSGPATGTSTTSTTTQSAAATQRSHINRGVPLHGGDSGAASAALDGYWGDVSDGNYQQAYEAETAAEQHTDSLGDMEKEQPQVNVVWTRPGVADALGETARINFFTMDSDGVCRHFSIDSQMVRSAGRWLYDGPVSGATVVDNRAEGNANCPG